MLLKFKSTRMYLFIVWLKIILDTMPNIYHMGSFKPIKIDQNNIKIDQNNILSR